MSLNEYKKIFSKDSRTGSGPIYNNHSQDEQINDAYARAVQTLRYIQGSISSVLLTDPIRLDIDIIGNKAADVDNVSKAVADSLQGICYKNDKSVWKSSVERFS